MPKVTDPLPRLASAPSEIPIHSTQAIGKFVILMHDQTTTCTDVNKAIGRSS